jgi:hypothetical protein
MPIFTRETIPAFFRRNRPTLTIAALRENPWNVISHELPPDANKLLLTAARLAADYCSDIEYFFMRAARRGEYVPGWWDDTAKTPDAHEESEELFWWADCKLREIVDRLGEDIEVPLDEP